MKKIPNTLKEHRLKSNFTQTEVAKLLGLNCADRISRWEQGLTYPHVRNLFKLANIYEVKVEDLYCKNGSD